MVHKGFEGSLVGEDLVKGAYIVYEKINTVQHNTYVYEETPKSDQPFE